MNKRDIKIYQNRYNERLLKFGYSTKTLGWGGGKERQLLRFKTHLEIGFKENDSIIDIGCGFGDLYFYLKENYSQFYYNGIDINPKLIEKGKEIYPNLNADCIDILNTRKKLNSDWVISTGVFNAKLNYEDNFSHICLMITKMIEICNKGVSVDFISTYVEYRQENSYHTDPRKLIDFLKLNLKKRFILRMDYLPFEFCIYIFK